MYVEGKRRHGSMYRMGVGRGRELDKGSEEGRWQFRGGVGSKREENRMG